MRPVRTLSPVFLRMTQWLFCATVFVARLFRSDPNWNPEGGIQVQRGARMLGLGADGTGKDSVDREREERDKQ